MADNVHDDRAGVEDALGQANISVLRMALYQATRDPELADMTVNKVPLRGGAFYGYIVDEKHADDIRRKAADFLTRPLSVDQTAPDDDELRSLMTMMTGEPLTDREFGFGREELAFDEFPREARWASEGQQIPEGFTVAIIGAGASGIAAAIQFERLGVPYVIYERQSGIGGTWHLNHYPDARVDTSSFLYQYKFVKNYPWPEYFASQKEVKKYLEHVAASFGVADKIVFDVDMERATFQDDETWSLSLRHRDGRTETVRANVIISAAGQFSTPKRPDIPGVESFEGEFFHTTAWDDNFDPVGRQIAVIGNGSTGVQLMPKLAQSAAKVYAFQRTPQWISPMEGYRESISPQIRWLFDRMPFYWNWYCYHTQVTTSGMQLAQEYDAAWQEAGGAISERNDGLRANLTEYIRTKVGHDEELYAKLLPDYAPLARRLVVDNGWYDALLRDNVELVTEGIDHFTPEGIRTRDGRDLALDAVAFAGGFDVSKYLFPAEYIGRDGVTMQDAWAKDGPRAYLGMTVPDFPNLFIFYGPNSQPRSGAFLSWVEIWSRYAAQGVVHLIESGHRSMSVRREVFEDYNERLDEETKQLIWEREGPSERNYYINEHGRQSVNWPWRNEHYFEFVAQIDPEDFDVR
ncbi:MAG: hypothetical protein JWQ74_113 [Marmoricola sp.]|nr:hypothetical protein [Marmoricola sp.]